MTDVSLGRIAAGDVSAGQHKDILLHATVGRFQATVRTFAKVSFRRLLFLCCPVTLCLDLSSVCPVLSRSFVRVRLFERAAGADIAPQDAFGQLPLFLYQFCFDVRCPLRQVRIEP